MRVFVILCAALAVAAAAVVPVEESKSFASQKLTDDTDDIENELPIPIEHHTFFTRQDHTRPQVRVAVPFNYVANLEHYQPEGPFYIYLKDAYEVSNSRIESGLMVDLARSTGAALFTFDQRYFGNNNITSDNSFENLSLLTVEQSLADIALFIGEIRGAHQGGRSNIILWGSGYGGTLAAYARKRYPHLVDAVWSSSGTFNLEAFTFSQLDLLEYTFLTQGGELCRDQIKAAFYILNELLESGESEYVAERLRLCSPVDTESVGEVGLLFESHIQALLIYINRRHAVGVNEICSDMNRENIDPLNSFAFWKNHVYGHDLECFDYRYESVIERLSNTDLTSENNQYGSRQWYYLTCTQLGMFAISDDTTWLPNRLSPEYYQSKCEHIFGEQYNRAELTPAIIHLTNQFGSLRQRISNVIYTNGNIDPWLYNGMIFTRDLNSEAIVIPYAAKSADMGSVSSADWAALRETKQRIIGHVREFSEFDN